MAETLENRRSQEILKFYLQKTVFGEIANTAYEGEINKMGDTVRIRKMPTLTISDYKIGQIIDYDDKMPEIVDLSIDKGKSWAFSDNDIIRRQSDYDYVTDFAQSASEQLAVDIDKQILAEVVSEADTKNKGATAGKKAAKYNFGTATVPATINKTNIIDYIYDAGSVLSEQDVPVSDRWIVLPPELSNELQKSDIKDASMTGDAESSMRDNGRVGMVYGFTVYASNNLTSATVGGKQAYSVLFGHKYAISFAAQILNVEGPIRDESSFDNFYRGLCVYGYKVVKPEALGVIVATAA